MNNLFLFLFISFLYIQECYPTEQTDNIACPNGWISYKNSCYKVEKPSAYRRAKDKCSKFKQKFHKIKTPSLVNIEGSDEMDFVLNIMNKNELKRLYIGANNIVNKDNRLLWERIGASAQIENSLLCESVSLNSNVFSCGVLQKSSIFQSFAENNNQSAIPNVDFCVDISDCFASISFMCEVNCTNQESQCDKWVEEYNANSTIVEDICVSKSKNCKNNGTCQSISDDKYYCICQPGFNGTYCEHDERPCNPNRNRCRNNSTCSQNGWKYNCICQTGFVGTHCEININDCENVTCFNGGQCIDLISSYKCSCTSFFYGDFCEYKHQELVIKEQVSRSFSVLAIVVIILTYGFFISLDTLRYVFHIEPDSLSQERKLIKKKRLVRKIIKDLKSKRKRRRYYKLIATENLGNKSMDENFIKMFEKTFGISYDTDLLYVDEVAPSCNI